MRTLRTRIQLVSRPSLHNPYAIAFRVMCEKTPKKPLQPAAGTEFERNALQIDGFLTLVSEDPGEYVCLLDGTLYSNVPDSRVREMLTQALRNWQ